MGIIELFLSLVGMLGNFIIMIFQLILAFIAAGIATYKRRSGLFWGVVTFIFPFAIFAIGFLPRKYAKLPSGIRNLDAFRGKHPVIASIMALTAMIAKSDGAVTKEEIQIIRDFVSKTFRISKEELNAYAGAFEYGKNHPEEYAAFASVIRDSVGRDIRLAISYLFVALGMEGDKLSATKESYITKILGIMGISNYEYQSIKRAFTAQDSYNQSEYGYYQGGYQGSYQGGYQAPPRENLVKKYSEVLGVSEEASMNEIKKAYRKLVKEYHPDKLASESMPPDYVEFANKKIIEVNEAYEYLKNLKEHA